MLGARIAARIDQLGLSIPEAASHIGIQRTQLYAYLNESRQPNAQTLKLIATKLEISVDWLLGLKTESEFANRVLRLDRQERDLLLEYLEFLENRNKKN